MESVRLHGRIRGHFLPAVSDHVGTPNARLVCGLVCKMAALLAVVINLRKA